MTGQDIRQNIIELIEPIIKDNFMELVDIELLNPDYLRITIDKQGGVTLDDCSSINRTIGTLLKLSGYDFSLEVSSPGIDRPLKKISDFERFIGKKAKIVTRESISGINVFEGIIEKIINEIIIINTESKKVEIQFNNIKKANLIGELKI
ncbi:MAG: ribosome maturation factor RimP [Candidatus Goldbacteria bacterium]|nr:ribosome maturation factor RimP [Candidatus Goldiibacteriota bacterium]